MPQMPGQKRRRSRAIDVIVAEDRNLLAAHCSIRDTPGGGFHLGDRVRIRHQLADGRVEEVADLVDRDIAPRQHARQHFRQIVPLHDRERPRRPTRIQPIAPELSGQRPRHPEKRRRRLDGYGGCVQRHGFKGPGD